jgi:hypothetical protein
MSRYFHGLFDGLDSAEGIPTFYLRYVCHSSASVAGILNGKPCQVYETKVNVVFKDEEAQSVLAMDLKPYTIISSTEVQLLLYFPSPEEFKVFSDIKAEETMARWRSFDGAVY